MSERQEVSNSHSKHVFGSSQRLHGQRQRAHCLPGMYMEFSRQAALAIKAEVFVAVEVATAALVLVAAVTNVPVRVLPVVDIDA